MGWTSYHASAYKNGKVDIMAECISYFMGGLNAGSFEIVDCALKGNVWYGAVKCIRKTIWDGDKIVGYENIPENEQEVWGCVILTHVDNSDYFNFCYKEMSENMGPYESKCPKRIIKKLSPTTNEYALAWRKRCMEATSTNTLAKLPIGTVIEFEYGEETKRVKKMAPSYQFKTAWYLVVGKNQYFTKSRIPKDFRIVETV